MEIKLDLMASGVKIIYNDCCDGQIEEPCEVGLRVHKNGMVQPVVTPLLSLSNSGKVFKHFSEHVLFTTIPVDDLKNHYIDILNQLRAQRSGIITPTSKEVLMANR